MCLFLFCCASLVSRHSFVPSPLRRAALQPPPDCPVASTDCRNGVHVASFFPWNERHYCPNRPPLRQHFVLAPSSYRPYCVLTGPRPMRGGAPNWNASAHFHSCPLHSTCRVPFFRRPCWRSSIYYCTPLRSLSLASLFSHELGVLLASVLNLDFSSSPSSSFCF